MDQTLSTLESQSMRHFSPLARFFVRFLWAAVIAVALTSSFFTMPVTLALQMRTAVTLFQEPLASIGWSPVMYAIWSIIVQQVYVVIALIAAFMLAWQRPHDWLALLTGLVLVLFGTTNFGLNVQHVQNNVPAIVILTLVYMLLVVCANMLLLVFPDGRFYPRWTAFLLIPLPFMAAADTLVRVQVGETTSIGSPITTLIALWTLLGLGNQLYRYRVYLSPAQKQQVKWVIAGMGLVIGSLLTLFLIDPLITPYLLTHPRTRLFYRLFFPIVFIYLPLTFTALTFINAVLRRNLWAVDFTINRSLGFGLVALGGTFFIIAALYAVEDVMLNPLGFGALIVALGLAFNPLRRLIQRQIDRRLYDLRFPIEVYQHETPRPEVVKPGMLTGKQIDQWELLDFVGRGATSEVYKGFGGGVIVAVKLLPSSADAEVRQRFAREVEILKDLDHPNVVRLMQHGEIDDMRYLVTRFVEGETLRERLERTGQLPFKEAIGIAKQIAAALDYVHARGVIHRDLKPSNIMLTTRGQTGGLHVVLMDFGIAKADAVQITGHGTMDGDD